MSSSKEGQTAHKQLYIIRCKQSINQSNNEAIKDESQ